MKTNHIAAIIISLTLAVAGCSDDDEHGHNADGSHAHADGVVNINEEACEHIQKGPYADVTAGKDFASATAVKSDHKAYRVTLVSGAASYVKYAASAKGDLVLFVNQPAVMEVQDDAGQTIKFEVSDKSVKECTDVKGKHIAELPKVGTYYIKFDSSTAASTVSLVLERQSH